MERLHQGYCEWRNPFNARQRQIVRFDQTRCIVFWSKNPAPLIPYLDEIEATGRKFYFQFTFNNYEAAGLEPCVPALAERVATFSHIAGRYPVIWRYDPILTGGGLSVESHLKSLEILLKLLRDLTVKLVVSFLDVYKRVERQLNGFNSELRKPCDNEKRKFLSGLVELRNALAPGLTLATCAEVDINMENLGIQKNSCIDPALINSLCGEEIYKEHLSLTGSRYEKDKGQRPPCNCAPSKDIGSYRIHPCSHGCIYCYAGHATLFGRAKR